MRVLLLFFHPPRKPLRRPGFTIRAVTDPMEPESPDYVPYAAEIRFSRWELTALGLIGDSATHTGTHQCALVEFPDSTVSRQAYEALLELLTEHWKYTLRLAEYHPGLTGHPPEVPRYRFNPSLLNLFERGVKLLSKNPRFQLSLVRWASSSRRVDPLDSVLDCCSALEAALQLNQELRLRISLSMYHALRAQKKTGFKLTYEMYRVRNEIIHGGKIPVVSRKQRHRYVEMVGSFLRRCVELGRILSGEEITKSIIRSYS